MADTWISLAQDDSGTAEPGAAPAAGPNRSPAGAPDAPPPTSEGPASEPPASPRPVAPELFSQVYDSLRLLARQRMAEERAGHTLQATALVHEVYIRLSKNHEIRWDGPAHFYAAAAEAMRRILIEHARARGRVKRGDQRRRLPMDVLDLATAPDPQEILSFDEALCRLERESPETLAVVRMRFFAGLSVQETADVLKMSARTVNREWSYARAWLYRELQADID